MRDSTFIPLLDPLTSHSSSPSTLFHNSSQDLDTCSTWEPQGKHLAGTQKALPTRQSNSNPYSPHSPNTQKEQQKPQNKTTVQQRQDQILTPRIIIIQILDASFKTDRTVSVQQNLAVSPQQEL